MTDTQEPARPITPAEEAVIEAARKWAAERKRLSHIRRSDNPVCQILEAEVDALPTQTVRPEEVPPGTRFRMYGQHDGGPTGLVVLIDGTQKRGYIAAGDVFCEFGPEDRIIPLDQEEE